MHLDVRVTHEAFRYKSGCMLTRCNYPQLSTPQTRSPNAQETLHPHPPLDCRLLCPVRFIDRRRPCILSYVHSHNRLHRTLTLQEAVLPQTDRAPRCVSLNPVNYAAQL